MSALNLYNNKTSDSDDDYSDEADNSLSGTSTDSPAKRSSGSDSSPDEEEEWTEEVIDERQDIFGAGTIVFDSPLECASVETWNPGEEVVMETVPIDQFPINSIRRKVADSTEKEENNAKCQSSDDEDDDGRNGSRRSNGSDDDWSEESIDEEDGDHTEDSLSIDRDEWIEEEVEEKLVVASSKNRSMAAMEASIKHLQHSEDKQVADMYDGFETEPARTPDSWSRDLSQQQPTDNRYLLFFVVAAMFCWCVVGAVAGSLVVMYLLE